MATQISLFPDSAGFPPERPKSRTDNIIDHLFMVLPTVSLEQALERLHKRGLALSMKTLRHAIAHLRKHALEYQWTIPHVRGGHVTDDLKYFGILLEKDSVFHTDPIFKGQLVSGTSAIVTRISTESKNQSMMLRAASSATYLSRPTREELSEMADECDSIQKKGRRVMRYLKANNG